MMALRSLMSDPDPVIRYGAFAALRTSDPDNAYLGRVAVMKETSPEQGSDNMAAAISEIQSRRRRGTTVDDPFELYVVPSEGPPMVHYTRSNRAEIVLFGDSQKLETPIVLGGGGSIILNASESDDKVEISRITRNSLDFEKKVVSSLEMKDVIREVANLGATYPEIVELLNSASKQHNLQGQLLADARPVTSDKYVQAQIDGKRLDDKPKQDSALRKASAEEQEAAEEKGPRRIFNLPKLRGFGHREQSGEEPSKPAEKAPKESPLKSLRLNLPFTKSKSSLPELPPE